MTVSLDGIPKESNVYRFITSGKPGKCELCSAFVSKLEAHHLCYNPEITIRVCHNCHHKIHFWPQRLDEKQKSKLLIKRFGVAAAQKLEKINALGISAFSAAVAPSRHAFLYSHPKRKIDMRSFNRGRANRKLFKPASLVKS